MSGPYKCFECGGHGRVEKNFFTEEDMSCPSCNGTGERWLEPVFSPSQDDRDSGRVEYVDGKWRFKKSKLTPDSIETIALMFELERRGEL